MTNDTENLIRIGFCDNSSDEHRFATTVWGNMQAKADFVDLIQQANRNDTILASFPHIVELLLLMPMVSDEDTCEEFTCPCRVKESSRAG